MNYSTFKDQDRKLDIMDHVNQDHRKELLMIAQTYGKNNQINDAMIAQTYGKNNQINDAMIADIYEEGILLNTQHADTSATQQVFVAFELNGDLEEQILYLAYSSFAKQKIEFSHNAKQFFEVISKAQISKNFTRLGIKSQMPLPTYYAGYAYGFILKVLEKVPTRTIDVSKKSGFLKNIFDRGFLWLMKHLSSQKRQKLLESMNKDVRLYTLRQAYRLDTDQDYFAYGFVDIFTHGNSPGSQWVNNLKLGSLISSRTETDDKHEHLHQDQAILIADETAYPALAGILDFWKNPMPPIVVLLCSDSDDLHYFDDFTFPENTEVKRVICTVTDQAEQTIALLETLTQIDNVWGALENQAAKQIRHYLRNQRKLSGKQNHIKGYWRLTTH